VRGNSGDGRRTGATRIGVVAGSVLAVLMGALAGWAALNRPADEALQVAKSQANVRAALASLPLSYEENRGQADARVKFVAHTGGQSIILTPNRAVLALRRTAKASAAGVTDALRAQPAKTATQVVSMELLGANPSPKVAGRGRLPGVANYLIGKNGELVGSFGSKTAPLAPDMLEAIKGALAA
jgi:hypothetical protein